MKKVPKNVLDLPLEERALRALREAVRDAIAEQRRLGLPVYAWKNGKVVELPLPKPRSKSPKMARRHPEAKQD